MCFTSTVSDHQPSFLLFPRITFWPTTGLAHWCSNPQFKLQQRQLSEQSEREQFLSLSHEEQKHKRWNRLEQFGSCIGFHFQKLADAETLKLVSKLAKRGSLLFTIFCSQVRFCFLVVVVIYTNRKHHCWRTFISPGFCESFLICSIIIIMVLLPSWFC